jgi:hypothetical protein
MICEICGYICPDIDALLSHNVVEHDAAFDQDLQLWDFLGDYLTAIEDEAEPRWL